MRIRFVILLGLAAVVALVFAASGATWSNGGDRGNGFGTHDWVLKEANDLAASQGATWVDLAVALPRTDDPDTVARDFFYHQYDVWGARYGNAPKKVALHFEAARAALQRGDYAAASASLGLLSHYYSDVCNPLHTDTVAAEDAMHVRYEAAVGRFTDVADEHDDWVTFDGPTAVTDPAAFTVRAGRAAHADYARLVAAYSARGMDASVKAITRRSLDRAASGLADLIVTLGQSAPPPRRIMSVSGWVSDKRPASDADVTAYCKAVDQYGAPIAGVSVTFTWWFQDSQPRETVTTGADGIAACTRNIGGIGAGCVVEITMGASWEDQYTMVSASFAPG